MASSRMFTCMNVLGGPHARHTHTTHEKSSVTSATLRKSAATLRKSAVEDSCRHQVGRTSPRRRDAHGLVAVVQRLRQECVEKRETKRRSNRKKDNTLTQHQKGREEMGKKGRGKSTLRISRATRRGRHGTREMRQSRKPLPSLSVSTCDPSFRLGFAVSCRVARVDYDGGLAQRVCVRL